MNNKIFAPFYLKIDYFQLRLLRESDLADICGVDSECNCLNLTQDQTNYNIFLIASQIGLKGNLLNHASHSHNEGQCQETRSAKIFGSADKDQGA